MIRFRYADFNLHANAQKEMNNYARMLINKAEAKKAALSRSICHAGAHKPDPCQKNMNKIKEERTREHPKEERKKFIKEENPLKRVGVEREIIGEKQVDDYTSSYYKTEDWKSRSKALIEKAGGKCSKCNYEGKGLTMHHLTYAYKPHTEPEEALECLCKACHHLKHEINKIIHGSPSKKIDRLDIGDIPSPRSSRADRAQEGKLIKTQIEKFAPWMLEDNGDFLNRKLHDFLNLEKLYKLGSLDQSRRERLESIRVSALVIESHWVSTSGDTRQHKDKMKKSFTLSWKGYKKQWQGRLTNDKLKEFTEYCEENEIEYTVD